MEVKNLDFFFSSNCNLSCKYCYLLNNKEKLQNYNNDLNNKIVDGSFFNNVKNSLKEKGIDYLKIDSLSLWGAEPTLNSDNATSFLTQMFDYFENANSLFFSTNATLGLEKILPFIDFTLNYKRKIEIHLQISIDGPEWITKENRGKITDIIINTIIDLTKYLYDNKIDNVFIVLKPTLSMKQIALLSENIDKLKDWYLFFEKLQDQIEQYNFNGKFNMIASPTIANPEEYSIQDGKNLALFLKNISKLDEKEFKYYKKNNLYIYNVDQVNHPMKEIQLCSAGRGSYGIDKDGYIYVCHRDFTYPIVNGIDKNIDVTRYVKSDLGFLQMDLKSTSFHNSIMSRYEFFKIVAIPMAKYGFIDKKYLYNEEALRILFKCVNNYVCSFGQIDYTKELFVMYTGYLKLLGNGAVDELLKFSVKRR